ncbi:outer membrane protein assembly factor BamB family protein [Kitasatospora sp. NPDC004240]
MSEPLSVRRVLGGGPFAEIGDPVAIARCERRRLIAVGGDLGDLGWPGRSVKEWDGHRVGVYGLDGLDCRLVVGARRPVLSVDLHPALPLLAVGTGAYDGGYCFEGELLLVDLTDGQVVSALRHGREVRRVRWREDGRTLELRLSPYDDQTEDAFTHDFAALVERDDWLAVADRELRCEELTGPRAETERRDHGPRPAVREALGTLCAERGTSWSLRRQVRAVEALADGRVLAALEGTALECRLPSGEPEWARSDPDGAHQLSLCPDLRSVWVNVARPSRWRDGKGWKDVPGTVERLSLADGSTLDTVEVGYPAALTASLDGRIALRDTRFERSRPATLLVGPDGARAARVVVGGYDGRNQYFPVRRSPELLLLQGKKKKHWKDKWVVAVDPPEDGGDGEPVIRRLFPLEWDAERGRHLFGGPALRLTDAEVRAGTGGGTGGALVHAGAVHDGHGLQPGGVFIVRRRFPDGAPQWEFTGDHPVTALDTDGTTVYATLTSGELLALDAADGTPRWRTRLRVNGIPTTGLSLAVAGAGRLVVGTMDGRILLCGTASSWPAA